jgi:hypothetical protein
MVLQQFRPIVVGGRAMRNAIRQSIHRYFRLADNTVVDRGTDEL